MISSMESLEGGLWQWVQDPCREAGLVLSLHASTPGWICVLQSNWIWRFLTPRNLKYSLKAVFVNCFLVDVTKTLPSPLPWLVL